MCCLSPPSFPTQRLGSGALLTQPWGAWETVTSRWLRDAQRSMTDAAAGLSDVWFRHPVHCWARGRVTEYAGATLTISDAAMGSPGPGASFTVGRGDVHPMDPSHQRNLSDIALMNNMHEGGVRRPSRGGGAGCPRMRLIMCVAVVPGWLRLSGGSMGRGGVCKQGGRVWVGSTASGAVCPPALPTRVPVWICAPARPPPE